MKLTPEQRRLLALADAAESQHLEAARAAVLQQFGTVDLRRAEKALQAALKLPSSRRAAALRGVAVLIQEATRVCHVPPRAVLSVMRRAVRDRVLSAQDLAVLSDPSLVFGDTKELQASAVSRQRSQMNGYWSKESARFRDDVARTIREAIRRGLKPEQAADLLQERLGVSRSRAVLIAEDQIATAAATAERQLLQSAGVKKFRWRSLMDGKQRKSHERLHGRVFTWRSAPELPGVAVRCRCRALPVPPLQQDALYERVKVGPGGPVLEVQANATREAVREVLRGIQTAGMQEYLKANPVRQMRIADFGPDIRPGTYFVGQGRLRVNLHRPPGSYGHPFTPGQAYTVSSCGTSPINAARRTLVHELGHHLFRTGEQKAFRDWAAAFAQAEAGGRHLTRYPFDPDTRVSGNPTEEFFCECFAAYAFHRRAFRDYDPESYNALEAVLKRLGVLP